MTKFRLIMAAALLCFCFGETEAQQLTRRSQYMINPYLTNPGAAGTQLYSPIMATYRNQWAGFDRAPVTYTVSGHCSLVNNLGAGIIFMRDETGGALTRNTVELTGSYAFDLNRENAVSFGLSGLVNQIEFDATELTIFDINDPVLAPQVESVVNIDANFGMLVYGENYYVGFSFPQLFQSRIKVTSLFNTDDNSNARHYYFTGQYIHKINDEFEFIPSAFVKFIGAAPAQVDVTARLRYSETFWAGMSFRPKDAMVFLVGLNYKDFVFGYSYDATFTDATYFSPHSHEVSLGYRIPRKGQQFGTKSLNGRKIIQRKRKIGG